jgi:hypothetical protein
MTIWNCKDWLFLIHYPQVNAVIGVGSSGEEVWVYYIQSVCVVLGVFVEELGVFVYLPEDYLAVQAATHDSVARILRHGQDVGLVAVMRVHVHHFSDVPDFQASVVASGIELIVVAIERNSGDGVSVTQERLNLHLVMNVPNSNDSVFASADQELTVG